MEPDVAQFEQQYSSQVQVVKINVDNRADPNLQTYGGYKKTRYIPETIFLRGGTVKFQQAGGLSLADLARILKESSR